MRVFGRESLHGFSAYFSALVHPSGQGDTLTAARHQSFIASHLIAGLIALCVFPVYLVVGGKPSLYVTIAFLWLLVPIGMAIFLSRTGRLAAAHLASAANLAGLVTYCAWLTGGLSSWLLPWMVVVPLEAALATERRIVAWSALVAGAGFALLAVAQRLGYAYPAETLPLAPSLLALIGTASATLYAAALAMTVQLVYRRSESALAAGE